MLSSKDLFWEATGNKLKAHAEAFADASCRAEAASVEEVGRPFRILDDTFDGLHNARVGILSDVSLINPKKTRYIPYPRPLLNFLTLKVNYSTSYALFSL